MQIRDALSKNAVRVIDLFHEWDDDSSGSISKKEFCKALPMLGLEVAKKEIEALFDSWDPDGSGLLELDEMQKQLKRRDVEIDAALKPGAAGEIVLESKNKTALRTGKIDKNDSNMLQGLDLDENSGVPFGEQVGAPPLGRACLRRAVRSCLGPPALLPCAFGVEVCIAGCRSATPCRRTRCA